MSDSNERSRLLTWTDPYRHEAARRDLSGLEYVSELRRGTIPPPPMLALINATVVDAGRGRVTFLCRPGEEHFNPLGTVHGGLICTLLDSVAGSAAHTLLDAGVGFTSIEIKVNYLRPLTLDTGPVLATGTVTKAGPRVIFADAILLDQSGRSIANASSSLLVLKPEP